MDAKQKEREKLVAGLEADLIHLANLRDELSIDEIILADLKKKLDGVSAAILEIQDKINRLEAKLVILANRNESPRKSK